MPIAKNVKIGKKVTIPYPDLVNIFGCELGEGCFVGPFVEIGKGVIIGKNSRISSHSFVCEGVVIKNNVFIGHGVMFINDKFSDSKSIKSFKLSTTLIEDNVRIGSNATILPVTIGSNCIIGAGSVVTKNIPKNSIVAGVPGKIIGKVKLQ